MPDVHTSPSTPQERGLDGLLLVSIMLPVLATGINTIVGFTVAHWITITASKRTGYLVSAVCFVLCAIGAVLSGRIYSNLGEIDETQPQQGRRLFMAKLGLLLSTLAIVLVLASTLVLVTVGPSD